MAPLLLPLAVRGLWPLLTPASRWCIWVPPAASETRPHTNWVRWVWYAPQPSLWQWGLHTACQYILQVSTLWGICVAGLQGGSGSGSGSGSKEGCSVPSLHPSPLAAALRLLILLLLPPYTANPSHHLRASMSESRCSLVFAMSEAYNGAAHWQRCTLALPYALHNIFCLHFG